jgi:hypothetical protein
MGGETRGAKTMNTTIHKLSNAGATVLLFVMTQSSWAVQFELVTMEEALRARAIDTTAIEIAPRSVAPGPGIEVRAPKLDAKLASPIAIEVVFVPLPGSRVDASSVRILYGALRLDVTERVLRHASVSESGIRAPEAKLPSGGHRLRIRVADSEGRVGERDFRFEVE